MSLRKAIDAKCRECIYDRKAAGTWRQQTEACTSPKCSLYAVRLRNAGNRSQLRNSANLAVEL